MGATRIYKTTEGNVVHYGFIEKFIEELGMKYNIKEIAFDRWVMDNIYVKMGP